MQQPRDLLGEPPEPTTMLAMLERAATAHPHRPALIEPDGEDATTVTYRGLLEEVHALQVDLVAGGVAAGDVVGLWLPNWHELVVWELAVCSLGATVLGINTRYNVAELAHLLQRAEPSCVALPGSFLDLDFPGRLRAALAQLESGGKPLVAPQVAVVRPGTQAVAELDVGAGAWTPQTAPGGATPNEGPRGEADALAHLFTTSGSTGAPKLAAHNQRSVARHSAHVAERLDLRPDDVVLGTLPLTGVFGFTPAYAALSVGAACLLEPVFRPERTVAHMSRFGVTHTVGADDLLGRIKDAWAQQPADLSAWRVGGIANFVGRVVEVAEWAETEFGARLAGVYGSSELFALTAMWPQDMPLPDRVAAGGQIITNEIAWRVADPASDKLLGPGEVGELRFAGYNVLRKYYGDPDATAAAFTDDGWARSGDLGYERAEDHGLVYLCRAGDELRLRGFLVDPAEVEQALAEHPAVDVAKVVGATRPGQGDVAVAFVTPAPSQPCGEEELLAWCRQRLASFKVPERAIILDEFPVTVGVNGTKIRTSELRHRARDLLAGAKASRR